MRLNDLNDGSIKTLLILGLLMANLALNLPGDSASRIFSGSARASHAGFGDPPKQASSLGVFKERIRDGGSLSPARESRAHPKLSPP